MTKNNRVIAVLLALAVCFVMLFSAFYIAAEANHKCVGDDCKICLQIDLCAFALKTLGTAVAVVFAMAAVYSASVIFVRLTREKGVFSLVSLKIKLLN